MALAYGMEPFDHVDRDTEDLMVYGFGWREAAAIANEAELDEYAVCWRAQFAIDKRAARHDKTRQENSPKDVDKSQPLGVESET